jgi:MFS family permease
LLHPSKISLTTTFFSLSVPELWHFILSFGLCTGLGASLLFTPSFAAPGHWFLRRRGLATGLAATGGSIGGVVFPLMLESLFPVLGWGWSIRVLGFLSLGLTVLANCLIRSRLPPATNASAYPDLRIFRSRAFLLCTIGIFLLEFALFIPVTYISSYARDNGFSAAFSYQILPILNAGSALGRALPGWWGDIIGPFNVNMLMIVGCIVSCLAVWLPAGMYTPGLVVYALLFGFASGSNISITPVCVGRLCKTQQYGRYYATCYTIVSFATLVGVPIAGGILTSNGGKYWGVIVFTGCLYAGAFVSIGAAKWCVVGWKPFAVF